MRRIGTRLHRHWLQTIAALGIALTLSSFPNAWAQPAQLMLPPLDEVEKQNAWLANSNLKELIATLINYRQRLREGGSAPFLPDQLDRIIPRFEHIADNIEQKINNEALHSVPGSFEFVRKDPRTGKVIERGSPKGLYCVEGTYLVVKGQEVPCPPGHILLEESVFDPGDGTRIDETNIRGWGWKHELLHLLAHEKMHEIIIDEQLTILTARLDLGRLTEAERTALQREATNNGATVNKHKEVYDAQIELLEILQTQLDQTPDVIEDPDKKVRDDENTRKSHAETVKNEQAALNDLKEQRAGLREQLGKLESTLRGRPSPGLVGGEIDEETMRLENNISSASAALDRLELRIREREFHIAKLKWLRDRLKRLREARRRATQGHNFAPWERCGFPSGVRNGLLHMYVTIPGFYARLDAVLREGKVVRTSDAETAWPRERYIDQPIPGEPNSIIVLPQNIFTGAHVQPEPCGFLKGATDAGLIRVVEPSALPSIISSATGLTFVKRTPLVTMRDPPRTTSAARGGTIVAPGAQPSPPASLTVITRTMPTLYVGLAAGGTESSISSKSHPAIDSEFVNNADVSGSSANKSFVGGALLGLKLQSDRFMFGVEGTISRNFLRQDLQAGIRFPELNSRFLMNWEAGISARAGFVLNSALIYGKGGVTFVQVGLSEAATPDFLEGFGVGRVRKQTSTMSGWLIGVGVELPLLVLPNGAPVTVGIEYSYADYGRKTFAAMDGGFTPVEIELSKQTITGRFAIPLTLFRGN